jgi:diguanylate cyclase (GGDEF)-like protein
MTSDEIKLGYLLLKFLRVNARDRAIHKFNVIGRSRKGEFEFWLQRDVSSSEKQSLIWIWEELKRTRLINATGEDLVNPDDWVLVSPKGLTISEGEFAELFSDKPGDHGRMSERLIDAVTGIFQRGELNNDLGKIENREGSDPPLAFIMIDIDHFKEFNTIHGHPIADKVLRTVAQTVAAVVRGKGESYRYGGDELSVILPNHNLAEAQAVAERIRSEVETARIDSLPGICVTTTVGVASIPDTSENVTSMVADADRVLLEAKSRGRNRVYCASKETSGAPVTQEIEVTLGGDLSPDAIRLIRASESTDGMLISQELGAYGLSAGGEEFLDGTARSAAKWRAILGDLLGRGILEATADIGVYRLSAAGYEIVDKAQALEEASKPTEQQARRTGSV